MPLDLSIRRDLGALLGTTFRLFASHAPLFLGLTLLVVAPYVVLVQGLWQGGIHHGAHLKPGVAAAAVGLVLQSTVIPALITALHVAIVAMLGRGERPTARAASGAALRNGLVATGAVALYALAVFAGFVLCILPGIYVAVRFYFAAQAAVVDRASPADAVRESVSLTAGRWWETFGSLLVIVLIAAVPAGIIAAIVTTAADSPAVYLVTQTVTQTITLSLTALFGTLLFFSHRAARQPTPLPDAPERPVFLPPQA